jgi:3-oxoadipate enol-lactonase
MRRFVEIGGTVLHAEYRPAPGRPALVLINALGTDFRMWDRLVTALEGRFAVLRHDKQGHGLSGLAAGERTIADYAADVAALMAHFGVGEAIVAGDSIGGAIAQTLALARPDLVAGLVLLDTLPRFGTPEIWAGRIAELRAGGVAALADAVVARWFPPEARAAHAAEVAGWRTMVARTDPDGYAAACGALARFDLSAEVGRLRLPVFVGVGGADGSTPPDAVAALAAAIPAAEFHVFDGVGHLPPVECPGAVAARIIAFAARCLPAAAPGKD